jgi:glycosyltransferase involved in cell wall biosynthesis
MTDFFTSIFVWSTLAASAFVSVMFLVNLLFFRKAILASVPAPPENPSATQDVSVLIPARNEALRIGPLLYSVLASEGVSCDLCVLDDESRDGTDAIVETFAKRFPNVRLLKGIPVPAGWSGKQFACYQLAQQAKHEELVFLDADVALSKDALRRAIIQRRRTRADLLSGFPQQRVITIGEQMLIPLIHVILLCFLPFALMRWTRMTGAAAGCGQFFLTTKRAYAQSGGHGLIRQSMHDGIMLPRAYRMAGLKTDLFDASDVARCRMYTSFAETWSGLMKNANEGFAKMPLLLVMTILMLLAFVCPLLSTVALSLNLISEHFVLPIIAACVLSYLPRVLCCLKFDRAWLACLLNPVSIVLFLIIQWTALIRKLRGKGVQWRQRSYEMATS